MTESAVADFLARYRLDPADGSGDEPRKCRVVMSERRIVVARDDDRLTVPLSAVVDVVVGNVPADVRELYDDTVTVAYETGEAGVRTLLLEAGNETMTRFVDVLFKCLLNGTGAVVEHPAKVGGRVTGVEATPAKLSVGSKAVDVATPEGEFTIDITTVVDYDRAKRSPRGVERPSLEVTHADGADVVTTLLAPDTARAVNLLGRYLNIEYTQLRRAVQDVSLEAAETRALVAVYASGDVDLPELLDGDAARASAVLESLREKDLVAGGDDGLSLTSAGRVLAIQRLEDVDV